MAIDYSKLRNLSAAKLSRALERDGFDFVRQRASHRRYHHPDGRRVTVVFPRPGYTYRPKTLKSIIETQAKWTEADLKRLKLLPKYDP
ncbi:MAG: type II toxin-antitoxin system HicA family toxin [Candidatus Bipolaricaulia bacterium]